MAKEKVEVREATTWSNPIIGMLTMAIAGGIIVSLSFFIIQYWPLPVAVAPYYEDSLLSTGFLWGFVVGGFFGLIIGYLTDEKHFDEISYE